MLLNYLKLSLRLLVRNPFFSLINVLGLSVGFASFFILWQYSSSELKADQFHKDFERIARIAVYWRFPSVKGDWGLLTFGGIRPHQAPMIANDFPQVEQYLRLLMQPEFEADLVGHDSRVVVSVASDNGTRKIFEENRMVYADSNLFDFFSIPLVYGQKESALKNAQSVVLSQHTANKYFGKENPVGKLLVVNDTVALLVTGVFQDLPYNTHLTFDLVVSMTSIHEAKWKEIPYKLTTAYVKVTPKTVFDDLMAEVNKHIDMYWAAERKSFPGVRIEMFFQPLKEIAFSAPHERDYLVPKTKSTLILMQIASILILAMAWINYNNLTVSRMMKRMKEIATRKMTGALSRDFAKQFVIESFLVNALAVAVAFTIMQLVQVPFNELFKIHVPEFSSLSYETWFVFILAILSGILISGFYPTIMASSYDPRALFSMSRKGGSKRWVQWLLSTSQYVMALVLMLWVYIVFLQLNFILGKDLGIQRDQVVVIDAPIVKSDTYLSEFESFLNALRSVDGVGEATYSATVIGDTDPFFVWVKGPGQPGFTTASSNGGVDESYVPFYRIPILAGRNFVANDKPNVAILSPQATRRLGYARPGDAVGDKISIDSWEPKTIEIVGLIDDYRVKPLFNLASTATENRDGIGICLLYRNGIHTWRVPERISIRIEFEKLDEILQRVEHLYRTTFDGNVFTWYFLDDHINKAYDNDRIARNQIALFACIAIGLSCLGLLGMMTTIAEEKVKEIGIRKVLGADARQIALRLIKSVLLPVAPAIVVAIPVSYFLADQFLDRYLERISLHWWHFVIPVLIVIALLLGTIASLLLKSAYNNPVEALKYE